MINLKNRRKELFGIVNQLYDLAEVPVDKRQSINDTADDYLFNTLNALFNPELKPLSELANDEEDCRKVFELFMGEQMLRKSRMARGVQLQGYGSHLFLEDDGDYSYFGDPNSKPTMFEFVNFLTELGYKPVKL